MAYISPDLVLSPKGRITDLTVLHDTGEHGYSIARMTWDGDPGAIGVRWNGGGGDSLGNPQSRGIPTWFILPDDLASLAVDWVEKRAADLSSSPSSGIDSAPTQL